MRWGALLFRPVATASQPLSRASRVIAYWPSSSARTSLPGGCWPVRKIPIFIFPPSIPAEPRYHALPANLAGSDQTAKDAFRTAIAFLASQKSLAINGETIAAGGGTLRPINY
jgi:hypothetical protein